MENFSNISQPLELVQNGPNILEKFKIRNVMNNIIKILLENRALEFIKVCDVYTFMRIVLQVPEPKVG